MVDLSRLTYEAVKLRGDVALGCKKQRALKIEIEKYGVPSPFHSDGLAAYKLNVPFMLRDRVNFGVIIKQYASTQKTTRYSPAKIISATKITRYGKPDGDRISTSHIERLNLTIRMNNRRFTQLTNAHSKSLKHHRAMQAIFIAWYNFCRNHETIKQTPAMASGLPEKAWTIGQLLEKARV